MTKNVITEDQTSTIYIEDSNNTYILSKGTSINVTEFSSGGISEKVGLISGNRIIVNGSITVSDQMFKGLAGVTAHGEGTKIVVGKSGAITAVDYGIDISSDHGTVTNNGHILMNDQVGYAIGINTSGFDVRVTNYQTVKAAEYGVQTAGTDSSVFNGKTGKIVASEVGIASNSISEGNKGDNFALINHGLIKGVEFSITNGELASHIVNRGVLNGDVSLGDGKDVFDSRGGKVLGIVYGGAGDDTYFTSTSDIEFSEGIDGGNDTVRASTSFTLGHFIEKLVLTGKADIKGTGDLFSNTLVGNAGDNLLKGLGGVDILRGGVGNDRLVGGTDADTFVFKSGYGHDTITDLSMSQDTVDLRDWNAIANLADLKKHHLEISGDNLIISAGSDELILKSVHKADLDNINFIF